MTSLTCDNVERVQDIEVLRRLCIGIAKQRDKLQAELTTLKSGESPDSSPTIHELETLHSQEISRLKSDLDSLRLQLFEQQSSSDQLKKSLKTFETENQQLREIVTETIDSKSQCEKEITKLNGTVKVLIEEKLGLEELLGSLREAKKQSELMISEAISQKEVAERDKKACQFRNKEFAKVIRGMQTELANLKAHNNNPESPEAIESSQLQLVSQAAEIVTLKSELENTSESLSEAKSLIDKLNSDLKVFRDCSSDSVREKLQDFENQDLAKQKKIEELEAKILKNGTELERLKSANSLLTAQSLSLQTEVESLRAHCGEGYKSVIASLNSKFELEITGWNAERSVAEHTITDLKTELNVGKLRISELERLQESAQSLINQLTIEVAELKTEITVADVEKGKLRSNFENAQKKISELENQNHSLLSQISNLERLALIGEKSTARCSELQKQLHEIQEKTIGPLTIKAEQFDSINSQLEITSRTLTLLKQDHEKLLREHEETTLSLRGITEELTKNKTQTSQLSSKLEFCSTQYEELQQQHSELVLVSTEQANSLVMKEKLNVKLKVLLNNYVTSDQRKQQQIDELQSEIRVYAEKFAAASREVEGNMLETVVRLESRIKDLEQRLNEGQASVELQAKNAQLAAMLEKSNLLYSQLMDGNRVTAVRVAREFHLSLMEPLMIEPHSEMQQREKHQKKHEQVVMINAYLKSTLIQFFGQDAASRSALIPLILELVGCTEQQIRAAQRQWERSNHLINKTAGFFGL
jgi:chromosome segregation ATPase